MANACEARGDACMHSTMNSNTLKTNCNSREARTKNCVASSRFNPGRCFSRAAQTVSSAGDRYRGIMSGGTVATSG